MKEVELQTAVIDLARICGWRCAHFRPAKTAHGWRTPVQADGAGFPDLVLTRPPELLIAELKAEKGRLSDAQKHWLQEFDLCDIEWYIWKPSDWDDIEARLTRPRQRIPSERCGRIHWSGTRLERDAA